MKKRIARRWSDRDTYFGPFTFARDSRSFGVILATGNGDNGTGAGLRVHGPGWTFIVALPSLWRLGRQYGAYFHDGYLHVRYGPQTMDSDTEKSWCWRIPWLAWRHVRHSLYGLRGEWVATSPTCKGMADYDAWRALEEACPSVSFTFDDFDGERIEAKTRIEEREWRLGEGWFHWLSFFRAPRIRRSLDIEFSRETGPKKGSWKGGTIGCGSDMQPGELHESAFRRYCAAHNMTNVVRVPPQGEERGA